MNPIFFETPEEFREWLSNHHGTAEFLWVGFYKKGSGRPSITWPESVDEALCFGWIDGVRKGIDAESYAIRFTRRKTSSVWSNVNINRVQVLSELGRMQPTGLAAFQARKEHRSGIYSHEQAEVELPKPFLALLRKNKSAWAFFQGQAASYRKSATWWVTSAKKEETRQRRMEALVAHSAREEKVPPLMWKKSTG